MKKNILSKLFTFFQSKVLMVVFLVSFVMFFSGDANAVIPVPTQNYDSIMTNNRINEYVMEMKTENALRGIFSFQGPLGIANIVFLSIGVMWLFILGIKFALARGEEDNITKYKQQFGWMALGLGIISIAEYAAYEIFDPRIMFENEAAQAYTGKISQILSYFQILVYGVCMVVCIMSGYNMVTGATEDDTIENEKRFLKSFLYGVALVLMANVIVDIVSLGGGLTTDATGSAVSLTHEIIGIVNFVLTFLAGAAVFMLILACIYYVINMGDEDLLNRAKKIIIGCVIGIIVTLSSYLIIEFFVR